MLKHPRFLFFAIIVEILELIRAMKISSQL